MVQQYTIVILNNSTVDHNYALFNQQPEVIGVTSNPKVFSNTWLTGEASDGGNWTVKTNMEFYAWCGKADQQLSPGVIIQGGQGKVAHLGTKSNDGSTFTMTKNSSGNPSFEPPYTTKGANASSYAIITDTNFVPKNNFLIGMGKQTDTGEIVPVACWEALPGETTNILPIVKFWVAAFNSSQGTIVSTSTYTTNSGVIDFSSFEAQGKFKATIKQDANGKWGDTIFT